MLRRVLFLYLKLFNMDYVATVYPNFQSVETICKFKTSLYFPVHENKEKNSIRYVTTIFRNF